MADRLKQIWGGFERETTRRLTGRGVENIVVPHAREWRGESDPLPEGIADPASAAFEALKARLAAQSKGRRGGAYEETPGEPPIFSEVDMGSAHDLVRGLASTEARTRRTERLYGDALAAHGGRKRKKLFGIF